MAVSNANHTEEAGAERSERQPWYDRLRLPFIFVLILLLGVGLFVVLPTLDFDILANALRVIYILIAGLLPAIIYIYFRDRRSILFDEYEQSLRRLGLPGGVKLYRDRFDAIFGPQSKTSRDLSLFRSPIAIATLLSLIGWLLAFYPSLAGDGVLVPRPVPVVYGFLGAYVFGLGSLVRQYVTDDLQLRYYASLTNRYVIVLILSWMVTLLAPAGTTDDLYLLVAFIIGLFPSIGLRVAQRVGTAVLGVTVSKGFKEPHPLTHLEGLNAYHEDRLLLEGIENLQNLACADIVDLMLKTRLPVEQIVDWIDQALLRLHARDRIEHYQNAGLRTATDFLDAYYPPDFSVGELVEHRESIARLLDSYFDDDPVPEDQHLHTLTQMKMMASALGLDPNKLHIRHWRDHEYEALPEDIERDRLAADIKLMRDFPDEAITAYDDLLRRYPNYHSALLYRGLAYAALKEHSRAVDDYTAAIGLGGPKWENGRYAYMERGRALRALGQYVEAAGNYKEAIDTYKSFPEAHFDLAYLQTTYLHQYDEAIDHLRIVIQARFREAEALMTLGLARYERWKQKGKPGDTRTVELGQARADLERARGLQPDSILPYLNLAYLEEDLGSTADAIRTLTDALRLDIKSDPDNAYRACLRRGNLYRERKDFQAAIADYRTAIKLIPDNAAAYYNLGTALRKAGDTESALLAFRDAARLDSLHADASEALGDMAVALRSRDLLAEAERAYDNALQLAREAGNEEAQAQGHLNLGRLYLLWDERHGDAERELRQAAKLARKLRDVEEVLLLGAWFFDSEDPDTAISLFKISAERFEQSGQVRGSVQAYFQLGRACLAKGDSASARDAWEKAREQLEAVFDPQNQDDAKFREAIEQGLASIE